jgi:hypothetical protein
MMEELADASGPQIMRKTCRHLFASEAFAFEFLSASALRGDDGNLVLGSTTRAFADFLQR